MSTVYLDRCDSYENVLRVLTPIWERGQAGPMVLGKKVLLKVKT